MIVLFFAGLVVAAIGIIACIAHRIRLNSYECFPAVIIGIREKTVPKGKGTVQKIYAPVVKFTMYGTERTSEHYCYQKMTNMYHHTGDRVTVCIKRSDAKSFYFQGETEEAPIGSFMLIVLGVLASCVSLFFMFVK